MRINILKSLRGAGATKQSKNEGEQRDCFAMLAMTANTMSIFFREDEFRMDSYKQEGK